jgi:hypothetical protein
MEAPPVPYAMVLTAFAPTSVTLPMLAVLCASPLPLPLLVTLWPRNTAPVSEFKSSSRATPALVVVVVVVVDDDDA